ncbi:hypothetical protein E4U55_003708 [Claviceps digitariae]|nr:hypothetical protein E4U55_003708 [Claviceps digitariae]
MYSSTIFSVALAGLSFLSMAIAAPVDVPAALAEREIPHPLIDTNPQYRDPDPQHEANVDSTTPDCPHCY